MRPYLIRRVCQGSTSKPVSCIIWTAAYQKEKTIHVCRA